MDISHSKKNRAILHTILGSGVYKGFNVIIGLLIVRFSIELVGEEKYGVWLALFSLFTWFSAVEVGITNGIRNQITTYFTDKNFETVKTYIIKGYKTLFKVYFLLISLFLLISFFVSIPSIVLPSNMKLDGFDTTIRICLTLYFLHFIFFFLHSILLATHNAKETYLIILIQNLLILIGLLFFKYTPFNLSFHLFCVWLSIVPLIIWSFSSIFFYSNKLGEISPLSNFSNSNKTPKLYNIQFKFFLIQLCSLVIYSTDNIIIINELNGANVTGYSVSFKYFNLLTVLFNLILLPYWSSFTEAFHKNNKSWVVSHLKKLIFFWILILVGGVILLLISNWAFPLWIGKEIETSFNLSFFMLISVLLTAWNGMFSYFLNSISKINLQFGLLIFSASLNIPLSLYLIKDYQSTGVIIATCVSLLPIAILLPLQCFTILKKA